jgi:hypothetical protein
LKGVIEMDIKKESISKKIIELKECADTIYATLNEMNDINYSFKKSIVDELDLIEFGINEVRSGLNSIENFTYLILPQLINNIRSKIQ